MNRVLYIRSALSAIALSLLIGCQAPDWREAGYDGPDYPQINLVAGWKVDPTWPQLPKDVKLGQTPAINIDTQGRIWVLTRSEPPVHIFARDGQYLQSWGHDQFELVHQLHFDKDGNVWVADLLKHCVFKLSPGGRLLLTLGTPGAPGDDQTHLNMPTDMVTTPAGDIFVTDGYGNNRVVHYDAQGNFVNAWGTKGVEPGQFSLPHSIDIDSQGELYVVDRNNNRIQVFDQQGQLLRIFPQIMAPWTLVVTDDDSVWVCGSSPMRWGDWPQNVLPPKDQMVVRFDTTGRALQLWTFPVGQTEREQPGELNWLHAIAIDAQNNLYLGDILGQRAQKFIYLPPEQ